MQQNTSNQLNFLSQFPNLNAIENLWKILDLKLCKIKIMNKENLKIELLKVKWNVFISTICKLVESMPKQLAAIIKAKDGSTKY